MRLLPAQNPLACAVAKAALEVIVSEDLCARAQRLGEKMRAGLRDLMGVGPEGGWIKEVRGKGLLNAIVIDQAKSKKGRSAWDLCLVSAREVGLVGLAEELLERRLTDFAPPRHSQVMKSKGVLAKPTHVNMCVPRSLQVSNALTDALTRHSIRLAPPLVITDEQLDTILARIKESLAVLEEVRSRHWIARQLLHCTRLDADSLNVWSVAARHDPGRGRGPQGG